MRPSCGQGLEASTMLLYGGRFGPNDQLHLRMESKVQSSVSIIAKSCLNAGLPKCQRQRIEVRPAPYPPTSTPIPTQTLLFDCPDLSRLVLVSACRSTRRHGHHPRSPGKPDLGGRGTVMY
jgi:hypothetical protein